MFEYNQSIVYVLEQLSARHAEHIRAVSDLEASWQAEASLWRTERGSLNLEIKNLRERVKTLEREGNSAREAAGAATQEAVAK